MDQKSYIDQPTYSGPVTSTSGAGAPETFHLAQRSLTMKMGELTDVATNATGSVNLDEVPSMEEVPGPAETTVTRLTFRGGHQIDVYETIAEIMQLAHLQREPVRSPGALQ
jgi:hypothetical protein